MRRLRLNLALGGHFQMRLSRLRHTLKRAALTFDKFGEIDGDAHSLPATSTLFVDIDTAGSVPCIPWLHSVCRVIGLSPRCICYHRTRRGWHIIIVFRERFTELERICLQSILGDDSMRASLNFMRYWHSKGKQIPKFWRERSNILYKRKLQ